MKKTILFLTCIAIALVCNAQKVALHSSAGIQHFEGAAALQSAYTAALPGDTIYLSGGGSFVSPGDFTKSLTIYGAGHYQDSTVATGRTTISGGVTLREDADNFRIEGVYLANGLVLYSNEAVDNVVIKYCRIAGGVSISGNGTNPSKNALFVNSILDGGMNLENAQSLAVQNSFITSQIFNSKGGLFSNNIILAYNTYGPFSTSLFRNESNNNYVQNNIVFLNASSYASPGDIVLSGSGNTFMNNVFNHSTPNFGNFSTTAGNYSGIKATDILVNQSGIVFDYTHNYHLQDTSTYIGTDGTQVGIYGGTYPYKEGAVPSNPHIQELTVSPTTTNGLLNVQMKAAAQDY